MPAELNEENFNEFIQQNSVVVVDFWAPWCMPCLMLAPTLESLAEEYKGKVAFAKLNVDENPIIASEFGITAIPTLIIFKNAQPVERITGLVERSVLKSIIEKHI